jgi:hypothetical protein
MRVIFTKYAGKYISAYPSQGEPHGLIKVHQWEDNFNNLYERHCLNVEGMSGEVDCGLGITDRDIKGKRYCFPVTKKCFIEVRGEN